MSHEALLELRGISKQYPAVLANDRVSLQVMPGQIHAILGENGAGKSTLMKIIYGAVQPDQGDIRFNGKSVQIRNPQQARQLGISMVFQHFSLFDTLTVAQNVWLGLDNSLSLAEVSRRIRDKSAAYGLDLEPERPVHTLSVGEMQRVEIIRALLCEPRLLILDEPTSVLTPQAVDKLFAVLRQLVAEGCSILYISHKLHEIRALCTHCTVLRGGRVSGECDPREQTNASLSQMMIGSEPPALVHSQRQHGELVLDVRQLNLPRLDPFGTHLSGVDLQAHQGEIVGIAGVSGNGQRELLYALSGEDVRAAPDSPTLSLAHNLLLTRSEAVSRLGWVNMSALAAQASAIIAKYQVKAGGPQAAAQSLSGGNLQKFIVGREIDAAPRLLIVSQPTWGVDVGAAAQIRSALMALRDAGCAVLVVSEELDELFELRSVDR